MHKIARRVYSVQAVADTPLRRLCLEKFSSYEKFSSTDKAIIDSLFKFQGNSPNGATLSKLLTQLNGPLVTLEGAITFLNLCMIEQKSALTSLGRSAAISNQLQTQIKSCAFDKDNKLGYSGLAVSYLQQAYEMSRLSIPDFDFLHGLKSSQDFFGITYFPLPLEEYGELAYTIQTEIKNRNLPLKVKPVVKLTAHDFYLVEPIRITDTRTEECLSLFVYSNTIGPEYLFLQYFEYSALKSRVPGVLLLCQDPIYQASLIDCFRAADPAHPKLIAHIKANFANKIANN